MDERLQHLFAQLNNADGTKVTSYGHELSITEEQTRTLVALNFAFEGRIAQALDLLEKRLVREFIYNGTYIYAYDDRLVYPALELCPCLIPWCKHLLAAKLLVEEVAVFKQFTTTKELTDDEFISLVYSFNGKTAALVQ